MESISVEHHDPVYQAAVHAYKWKDRQFWMTHVMEIKLHQILCTRDYSMWSPDESN